MKNDIEELKNVADQLLIESAISQLKLSTLEEAFFELSTHLLKDHELSNLKAQYYDTLIEKSTAGFSSLSETVYHKKLVLNVQFEFQSHLKRLIAELK